MPSRQRAAKGIEPIVGPGDEAAFEEQLRTMGRRHTEDALNGKAGEFGANKINDGNKLR